MAQPHKQIQPVLAFAAAHLDEDVSLTALAAKAGLGFHLHLRCGCNWTAPRLCYLRGSDSVLNVALSGGFRCHESFCRAIRRRFGMSPTA